MCQQMSAYGSGAIVARALNQNLNLPALLGWRYRGEKWLSGPCPFCGGRDRFVLKRTSEGWRWLCRGCGDGRYHTAIDFVMKRDNLDFKGAIKALGGRLGAQPALSGPSQKPPSPPGADWQASAWRRVREAQKRLVPTSPGGRYLLSRGLLPFTWGAWMLGEATAYDPGLEHTRPCIVIPNVESWCSMTLWGIKQRFIDQVEGGLRYISLKGSQTVPFGLCYCVPRSNLTLLVVEGELNALSVWQCHPERTDVVSTGSETPGLVSTRALVALAGLYGRVAVWLDSEKRASDLARALRAQVVLRSPVLKGEKFDANTLLQRDRLHDFLAETLGVRCYGWRPREWSERNVTL